jgi:nucleoside-diphosphate-sugar epimerase
VSWTERATLVTGGAAFIGSALVDALVARGARVRVVDDLSSGRLENLAAQLEAGRVEFVRGDLRDPRLAAAAMAGISHVFHLAADHGGRGYVDLHNVECAGNLVLDGVVLRAAADAGVEKLVFASSGCVYPNHLQQDTQEELYLTEDMVGPPYDADNMYGWAKLMGELSLRHYVERGLLRGASCRYFTVYGPGGKEDHAVLAMIARSFVAQDPFEVWGTGEQLRNWTYIDDIVEGTLRAAERIDDGSAVNLGTMERTRVVDAARLILELMGRDAELRFRPEMPTGPYNRIASNRLAKQRLGWEPRTTFRQGVQRTIEWYVKTHEPSAVRAKLERALTER